MEIEALDGASRRPLGLVIVGGLLVSQLITLYITPVIYLLFERFQEKVRMPAMEGGVAIPEPIALEGGR